jgi:hypothetical protein
MVMMAVSMWGEGGPRAWGRGGSLKKRGESRRAWGGISLVFEACLKLLERWGELEVGVAVRSSDMWLYARRVSAGQAGRVATNDDSGRTELPVGDNISRSEVMPAAQRWGRKPRATDAVCEAGERIVDEHRAERRGSGRRAKGDICEWCDGEGAGQANARPMCISSWYEDRRVVSPVGLGDVWWEKLKWLTAI